MGSKIRISVFGGRDIDPQVYEETVTIGRLMAAEGWLTFCGGAEGVMEAIAKGAREGGGIVVGLLKESHFTQGNGFLSIPIATGLGIGRNALLAYNCDAALAVAGHYGTLSEIAYALQLKKPVVGYRSWDLPEIIPAKTPTEVIDALKKAIS